MQIRLLTTLLAHRSMGCIVKSSNISRPVPWLPAQNRDLVPWTPIKISQAAARLPKRPSSLPVNSYSPFKTQLICYLCQPPFSTTSPGRIHSPSFVIGELLTGTFVTSRHDPVSRPSPGSSSSSWLSSDLHSPWPRQGLAQGRHTAIWLSPRMTHKCKTAPYHWENTARIWATSSLFAEHAFFLQFLSDVINTFLFYKKLKLFLLINP